jgi:hypothetical protein
MVIHKPVQKPCELVLPGVILRYRQLSMFFSDLTRTRCDSSVPSCDTSVPKTAQLVEPFQQFGPLILFLIRKRTLIGPVQTVEKFPKHRAARLKPRGKADIDPNGSMNYFLKKTIPNFTNSTRLRTPEEGNTGGGHWWTTGQGREAAKGQGSRTPAPRWRC